jgi:hypothetical protein
MDFFYYSNKYYPLPAFFLRQPGIAWGEISLLGISCQTKILSYLSHSSVSSFNISI